MVVKYKMSDSVFCCYQQVNCVFFYKYDEKNCVIVAVSPAGWQYIFGIDNCPFTVDEYENIYMDGDTIDIGYDLYADGVIDLYDEFFTLIDIIKDTDVDLYDWCNEKFNYNEE